MAGDDLVAHGKADAAAARLGRALIELLLDVGQLRLGDAVAEVADADDVVFILLRHGDDDALAVAAVLGGVVEHVAEHLLQPLRVADDLLLEQLPAALILEGDAVLTEELAVGIDCVLELSLQIDALDAQREAAVLHLRELQQLLDHVRQAARLVEDNAHAAAQLVHVAALVGEERLAPASDGREGRAQLVGDGGDELRLHFFALADLQRHVVDVVDQLAHLVGVFVGDLDAVAAAGDTLGGVRHHGDGGDDAVDE